LLGRNRHAFSIYLRRLTEVHDRSKHGRERSLDVERLTRLGFDFDRELVVLIRDSCGAEKPASTADLNPAVVRGVCDGVVTVKQPYRDLGLLAGV
jgi:hypothetical protein